MTEGPDWQPTFDRVHTIPGSTKQQPAKKTWQDRIEDAKFLRRRWKSDVAVGLGGVETGPDWDVDSWLFNFGNQVTENTAAIANLNEVAAAANTTPLWVSDIDDMASFPRAFLETTVVTKSPGQPKWVDITTSSSDPSSNTTLYTWRGVVPVFQPVSQALPARGHIYYIPIVADRVGTPTAIRWIVGVDTSILSIDAYYISLCVYNPANGNVEKVWDSGDIKNGLPNSTSMQEVEISTGLSQQTTPGQLLFVAHQQMAPGALQGPRRFAAKAMSGIGRPGLLHNAACYVAPGHSDGIPSSISFSSLTRQNDFLPWASIRMSA